MLAEGNKPAKLGYIAVADRLEEHTYNNGLESISSLASARLQGHIQI